MIRADVWRGVNRYMSGEQLADAAINCGYGEIEEGLLVLKKTGYRPRLIAACLARFAVEYEDLFFRWEEVLSIAEQDTRHDWRVEGF